MHCPQFQMVSPLRRLISSSSFRRCKVIMIFLGSYSLNSAAGQTAVQTPQFRHAFKPSRNLTSSSSFSKYPIFQVKLSDFDQNYEQEQRMETVKRPIFRYVFLRTLRRLKVFKQIFPCSHRESDFHKSEKEKQELGNPAPCFILQNCFSVPMLPALQYSGNQFFPEYSICAFQQSFC